MNRKLAKKVAVAIAGRGDYASIIDLNESNFEKTISESPKSKARTWPNEMP